MLNPSMPTTNVAWSDPKLVVSKVFTSLDKESKPTFKEMSVPSTEKNELLTLLKAILFLLN